MSQKYNFIGSTENEYYKRELPTNLKSFIHKKTFQPTLSLHISYTINFILQGITTFRKTMAQSMAIHQTSSDCDNDVNTRSTSCQLRRRPLSIPVIVLLSVIASASILLVHSFSVRPIATQRQQQLPQRQSSSPAFTIHQKNQRQPLSAATNDDFNDEDPITLSLGASIDKKKTAVAVPEPARATVITFGKSDVGEYDPSENLPQTERAVPNVGDPQLRVKEKDWSVTDILKELAAIQQQGPQKYCILGTRHCSYLHQQIIELLAYALVLSGNHVYTSGAPGTNGKGKIRMSMESEFQPIYQFI